MTRKLRTKIKISENPKFQFSVEELTLISKIEL